MIIPAKSRTDHTRKYYSATNKNKILPCVMPWINHAAIMLSEINERETNTVCSHLYVEAKKAKFIETESRMVVARG